MCSSDLGSQRGAWGVVAHRGDQPGPHPPSLSLPAVLAFPPYQRAPLCALLHDQNRGTGRHTAKAQGLAPGWEGGDSKSAKAPTASKCVARMGAPPPNQILNHAPYLYVMVCQASVLQRGADQQSFDTLQLGSQPCLLGLCSVMDCLAWTS